MTLFHRLSLLTCALTLPWLASCNTPNAAKAQPETAQSDTSREIRITPVEGGRQDTTRELLGINEWKFKVDIPRVHRYLVYTLELREKGKPPRAITRAILRIAEGGHRSEIKLAMLPLGFDWAKSERVKVQFHLGGSVGGGEIENPFQRCTFLSSGAATALPDGSFLLMEGNTPQQQSPLGGGQGQMLLVLKLEFAVMKSKGN